MYTVRIGRQPSCSCPDARNRNLCKHHLYIMLRVLRLAQDDPCVWQRALLTAEVGCHSEDALARCRTLSKQTPAAPPVLQ